jgi:hypothetical protein
VCAVDLADPLLPSLPGYALQAIREALPAFDRQIEAFTMADAMLTHGYGNTQLITLADSARAGLPKPERARPVPGR